MTSSELLSGINRHKGYYATFPGTLITKQLHYIPGYEGHIPGFINDGVGKSIGPATHEILSNRSGPFKTLLADTAIDPKVQCIDRNPTIDIEDRFLTHVTKRAVKRGCKIYTDSMAPGYTGLVPREQNFHGYRFSESCRYGMATFEIERKEKLRARKKADAPWKPVVNPDADSFYNKYDRVVTSGKELGQTSELRKGNMTHIKGYYGFVPKEQFIFGKTSREASEHAVRKFAEELGSIYDSLNEPLTLEALKKRPDTKASGTDSLLPPVTGYGGHVPKDKQKGPEIHSPGQKEVDAKTGLTKITPLLSHNYHYPTKNTVAEI